MSGVSDVSGHSRRSTRQSWPFWRRYSRNPAANIGLVFVGVVVTSALLAPLLAPSDPFALGGQRMLQPPFTEGALLGTDHLGRDMLSRLLYGGRTSILVGVLAAITSSIIGVVVGALAGYLGGRLDSFLMRTTEYVQVIPGFFFAVLVVAIFGTGLDRIVIVIALLSWPAIARTARVQFLALRETEFVEAARAIGFNSFYLIFREMLPNAAPPLIVLLSLDVAQAVLIEASLSFLGLGDPSVISWGKMISDAQAYLHQAWWLSVLPGVAIFLLVAGANLIGDGLNDAFNPRLKGR